MLRSSWPIEREAVVAEGATSYIRYNLMSYGLKEYAAQGRKINQDAL